VHDGELAARVLQKACAEITERPQRLPLWSFRIAGLIRQGRLAYNDTWDSLYQAAWDGGADEAWIRRCFYHGIAAAQSSPVPTVKLAVLAGGVE
jgi:hypothetical protein